MKKKRNQSVSLNVKLSTCVFFGGTTVCQQYLHSGPRGPSLLIYGTVPAMKEEMCMATLTDPTPLSSDHLP